MEMTGEQRIEAPRDKVWAALNDPEVLRRCIPGCQSLEKVADDRMRAVVAVKVGPIGARFTGDVTLSDLDPPNGYRIQGEGQGGQAGFAKGGAQVRLREDGAATVLTYEASAQVGGKLAQLGGAIIDATARSMAGAFFKRLSEVIAPAAPATAAAPAAAASAAAASVQPPPARAATAAPPAVAPSAGAPTILILAVAVAALVGFLLGRGGAEEGASAWLGLAVGLLLMVVAAAAFEFGRRAGQPTIVFDPALLARLAGKSEEPKA